MATEDAVESTTTPSWLNHSFLEEVLRDVEADDALRVTGSAITYVVGKGDNYLSQMLRAHVEYTRGDGNTATRFLIVKCLPLGEFMQKMLTEGGAFTRELYTFQRTLPAMYQIVEEKTSREATPISSHAYYCPQPNAIVLEDLKQLGYKMSDRRAQLDLDHCKIALKTLARFHGMSVALYKKDPSFVFEYKENTFSEETRDTARNCVYLTVKELSQHAVNWPDSARFASKLRTTSLTCIDRMIELLKPRPGSLRVLNHGDIWTNNILFKYSETTGHVEDARFVDFQLCRFASPALDLQFFLYTSPRQEVRKEHWDEMMQVYHAELCETLTSLGCEEDVLSFQDLQAEMEYNSFYAVVVACTILIIILADPEDAMDLSNVSSEDVLKGDLNVMEKAQNGALFKKIFKDLLIHFEAKGLL